VLKGRVQYFASYEITMKHWYALYTKPHKEEQVCSFLERKGIETYLPTVKIRKNGHYKVIPFFSCYLFTRVLSSNGLSPVRWTPGLRKVISFGDQPAVVDEQAISLIKQRLADIHELGLTAYRFKPGDRVVVKSGPLRDFEAVFDQKLSSRDRAKILVDFLGRGTRCEVEVDCLEKVH